MSDGVDVGFFVEAVKYLGSKYGRRLFGGQGNDLIAALALAEETWLSMPAAPPGDKMTACPEESGEPDGEEV